MWKSRKYIMYQEKPWSKEVLSHMSSSSVAHVPPATISTGYFFSHVPGSPAIVYLSM